MVSHPKAGVKWGPYLSNCIKRGFSNLWILKRLVEIGAPLEDVQMTFVQRVRTHVEQNISLWAFSITKNTSNKIEKLQKAAVCIMLPLLSQNMKDKDYKSKLDILGLELLESRREKINNRFAKKTFDHSQHRKMFTLNPKRTTRLCRRVIVPHAKTQRYERSSIPSLAKIINQL